MKDRRLGRRFESDPRNAFYPVRTMIRRADYLKPRTWRWDSLKVLDQGQEGSCVGHGFAHEMLTDPYPRADIDHSDALKIYHLAQTLDDYPGENYDGTSVLAGVKALQEMYRGIDSYRWATSLADVVATIGYFGPVVIGVNWYEGMFEPDPVNYIHVKGEIEGGHCCLLRGVDVEAQRFLLQNSWGTGWGTLGGNAFLSFDDFARLLREQGEACVIVHKEWWKEGETNDERLQA